MKLIIAAKEYSKLIGVASTLKANDFFEKCFNGTISINDFDCDSREEIKGKSREKLKHLKTIGSFFERVLVFQEDYQKNTIKRK